MGRGGRWGMVRSAKGTTDKKRLRNAAIDYGWRRGTSGNVHKIENKNGCKETPFNDTLSTFRRDEVLWVRSRRQGRSGPFRESRMSGFNCYCCKRTGHGWRDCPERVCNKCGKKGHDPSDPQCPLSYRERKPPNNYGASRKVYRVSEDNTDERINAVTGNSLEYQEGSVTLEIRIEGKKKVPLLDTGARPSVIDIRTLAELGLEDKLVELPDQVFGLCKSLVEVKGHVDVEIQVAEEIPVVTRMKVLDSQEATILLGREFLRKFGSVTFDFEKGNIRLGRLCIPIKAAMMGVPQYSVQKPQ